jgi:hypothetical protein
MNETVYGHTPMEQLIEKRAYQLWERHGKPENCGEKFWYMAEKELKEENLSPPPSIKTLERVL